jgi:hypothetical protein
VLTFVCAFICVLQAYARHGSNWLKVSEYLPMRSPQNIKNQVGFSCSSRSASTNLSAGTASCCVLLFWSCSHAGCVSTLDVLRALC